jgi:hypothetical protein
MIVPRKSSKRGIDHPPEVKPPLGSSSGMPGPWMTPSSVRKERTISFLMGQHLLRNVL